MDKSKHIYKSEQSEIKSIWKSWLISKRINVDYRKFVNNRKFLFGFRAIFMVRVNLYMLLLLQYVRKENIGIVFANVGKLTPFDIYSCHTPGCSAAIVSLIQSNFVQSYTVKGLNSHRRQRRKNMSITRVRGRKNIIIIICSRLITPPIRLAARCYSFFFCYKNNILFIVVVRQPS